MDDVAVAVAEPTTPPDVVNDNTTPAPDVSDSDLTQTKNTSNISSEKKT